MILGFGLKRGVSYQPVTTVRLPKIPQYPVVSGCKNGLFWPKKAGEESDWRYRSFAGCIYAITSTGTVHLTQPLDGDASCLDTCGGAVLIISQWVIAVLVLYPHR